MFPPPTFYCRIQLSPKFPPLPICFILHWVSIVESFCLYFFADCRYANVLELNSDNESIDGISEDGAHGVVHWLQPEGLRVLDSLEGAGKPINQSLNRIETIEIDKM
jgi:hypothetical protein